MVSNHDSYSWGRFQIITTLGPRNLFVNSFDGDGPITSSPQAKQLQHRCHCRCRDHKQPSKLRTTTQPIHTADRYGSGTISYVLARACVSKNLTALAVGSLSARHMDVTDIIASQRCGMPREEEGVGGWASSAQHQQNSELTSSPGHVSMGREQCAVVASMVE